MLGTLFWRRPTLARPIAVLPSGLQRFTAVFGMGTGGATALLSPEVRAGLAVSVLRTDAASLATCRSCNFKRTGGSLISTYRFSESCASPGRRGYNCLSFVLRSFDLLCLPSRPAAAGRRWVNRKVNDQ